MQVRALAATVVLAALLAGCGGGDEDPSDDGVRTEATTPTTQSPPPLVYTADQLLAALPTTADLQTDYETVTSCPDGEGCSTDTLSVAGQNAGSDATWGIGDSLWLALTPAADEAAAADILADRRTTDDQLAGEFTIPPAPSEVDPEHYAPGKTGTGTVEDYSQGGWTGYRSTATYHLTDPEGAQTDDLITESLVRLTRGNVVLEIQYAEPGEDGSGTDTERDARLDDLLDALAA